MLAVHDETSMSGLMKSMSSGSLRSIDEFTLGSPRAHKSSWSSMQRYGFEINPTGGRAQRGVNDLPVQRARISPPNPPCEVPPGIARGARGREKGAEAPGG